MSVRILSGPLRTERLPDGRRRLLRDFEIEVDGKRFLIPAGTITDYSSVPWLFRWLVLWSKVDIAGVVHDWLYQTGDYPRREADAIWRKIANAGEHRANWAQAWTGWTGLRLGGWWRWRKYRKAAG